VTPCQHLPNILPLSHGPVDGLDDPVDELGLKVLLLQPAIIAAPCHRPHLRELFYGLGGGVFLAAHGEGRVRNDDPLGQRELHGLDVGLESA
jgi:hypothetical protein